ncbi:hypothetical protein [Kordia jejudonensis]|uniref:hypothetical protein n=1 Tax=Kordia jejudonensis TaxID=1348245 RepID=UPI00062962AC|nr:hypothetical protein [Kordia jejudonensis]
MNFFKKIRQQLVKDSKLSKYLTYAIGEIILVVIGILIALQIDGWKEQQDVNALEYNILQNLYRDLSATKEELENDIKANKTSKQYLEIALHHLDQNTAYTSALDTLFPAIANWESPLATFTTYEIFKTEGIRIIKNKDIKNGVIKFHETTLGFIVNDYDKAEWVLFENVTLPFITEHLSYLLEDETIALKPNNYDELTKNPKFRNILTLTMAMRAKGLAFYATSISELNELLQLIKEEIEEHDDHE